jgi:phenylpyruvate tautomerase PptA (4-oxalocrotonate tautomerase family)
MPLLSIETNQALGTDVAQALLDDATRTLAEMLGKPEHYVMLRLTHNPNMRFGGTAAPLAYLELKSLGLPEQRTAAFSAALAELLGRHTDIPPSRMYIEFAAPQRHFWGYDGGTF